MTAADDAILVSVLRKLLIEAYMSLGDAVERLLASEGLDRNGKPLT